MSISNIEKHTLGDKKYLRPSDYDSNDIFETICSRSRFNSLSELLAKLEEIDDDDFCEYTNKYFISANHINDAYIAVMAIYFCIADKLDSIGELINLEGLTKKKAESNVAAAINMSAEMNNPETAELLSCENNPLVHICSAPSEIGLTADSLLDRRVEFFICTPAVSPDSPALSSAMDCCSTVFIGLDSPEEAISIINAYFWEKNFSAENVQKEIRSLVRQSYSCDEYIMSAAARFVITNHLKSDPSGRELTKKDFKGTDSFFSTPAASSEIKGNSLIGLENETDKLNGIIKSIMLDKLRFERGLSDSFNGCSMVFAGPPGTAKTTLARRFADMLMQLKLIKSSSCFKECRKSDIVGQYVGQTATKVDSLFSEMAENGGGVIFFDEIYTLSEENATIFDKEAVTCITQNMENFRGNVFCIFAGYENKMTEFLSSNPGMKSRISFVVRFEEYCDDDLIRIFGKIAENDNFKIPDNCSDVLRSFFIRLRKLRGDEFGNGREARNLFVNAKQKHAVRIAGCKKMTDKMLTVLDLEDISEASADIISSELEAKESMISIGF
ncbi:MAG: AAA family ATPase [Oscillospiraceae bacterium]|nr:AAA family ATPase [Oscillospiraceae bacterium]